MQKATQDNTERGGGGGLRKNAFQLASASLVLCKASTTDLLGGKAIKVQKHTSRRKEN